MLHQMPLVILGLPWFGGLVALLGRRRGRMAEVAALATTALCCALLVWGASAVLAGPALYILPWMSELNVSFALRLDALALPFAANTGVVSLLALAYGWDYLKQTHDRHLCYALMLAFLGSMMGTVLADDVYLFFVLWEMMLVTSSLLLAYWGEGLSVRRVTLKYFIYTQAGSLLILLGLARLANLAGTSDVGAIAEAVRAVPPADLLPIAELLLVGFAVKMAIFPFHTWLPDAHSVAPMPVTVMLAAAMLGMGVYGIARFPMEVLGGVGMRELLVPLMVLALASVLFGGAMCLATQDMKRLIAYSSVSQMGYILFALATLVPLGVTGGILHVLAHGWVKAALFMGVGLVRYATGRPSLEGLGGLIRTMPAAVGGLALGALALAGTPPFGSFHSEMLIFEGGLSSGHGFLGQLLLLSPVLTVAYGLWFVSRLAFGTSGLQLEVGREPRAMRVAFYAALAGIVAMGFAPTPLMRWAMAAASLVSRGG